MYIDLNFFLYYNMHTKKRVAEKQREKLRIVESKIFAKRLKKELKMLIKLLAETTVVRGFSNPFESLPLELDYFLKILIGGALGLMIGTERSRRQKEAGKATHFVVGCASTLLTCISLWFKEYNDIGDGARIAAQIVTGVGFLGAGMIFFRRESLRGLTTAAGIWATAAIGMCVATGMLWVAVGSTAVIIIVQVILHSGLVKRNNQHLLLLKLEYSDELKAILMDYFGIHNFHRFKITATNEKFTSDATGKTKINDPETEEQQAPVVRTKKYIAETVIYPVKNVSAEAIAQFMREHPQVLSIERLEDL